MRRPYRKRGSASLVRIGPDISAAHYSALERYRAERKGGSQGVWIEKGLERLPGFLPYLQEELDEERRADEHAKHQEERTQVRTENDIAKSNISRDQAIHRS